MKKYFLPLLGFAFLFAPLAHADFPDVPATSEYYQSVSALEDLGIVKGYPDGTFKLDRPVQRDELLKMAYLAEAKHYFERRDWVVSKLFPFGKESTIKVDPLPFSDVKSTDWAAPYIAWGKQQGLIGGYPDGSFKSMQGVNFAEAAKMLVETSFHPSVRQGEHWAEGYIEILGMGMIPSSIQTADQVLTRGQVADLIYNYTLATNDALSERSSNVLIWENEKYLTFECLGAYETLHFLRREGVIYWRNVDGAANLYDKLEGADAASFEVLESGLSKDKNRYYYYTDPLNAVIPNIEDLEFLTPNLALNGSKAYYFNGPSDVKTLDYIGSIAHYGENYEYYMKEGSTVYYLNTDQMNPPLVKVEGADVNSFTLAPLRENGGAFIALDDNALYWKGEKVEGSAGGSFQLVGESFEVFPGAGFYGIDDENVYFIRCFEGCTITDLIPNGDVNTLKYLGGGYAADANQTYYKGDIIPLELDFETLEYDTELKILSDKNGEHSLYEIQKLLDPTLYVNEKWNFSLNIPEGYYVNNQSEDSISVIKSPSKDGNLPDMSIRIQEGENTSVEPTDSMEIISEEEIMINFIEGKKTIYTHIAGVPNDIESLCPVYKLANDGLVYQFNLYECLNSDIFEEVVHSFRIFEE